MGGLTNLLLLLCVGVTGSAVLDLQKRIIVDHDCLDNERQYHVKFINRRGALLCGGSLLKNNWILTAAHCWEWGMTAFLQVPLDTSHLLPVVITENSVKYMDNNKGIHDVMLLKLPSNFSAHIKPVDLPDCTTKPKLGDTVQIAGYAATTKGCYNVRGCDVAKKLQCADVKLTDCTKLKNIVKQSKDKQYLYDHLLCGETSKVDASPGDSGGGVVVGNVIYGVISLTGSGLFAHKEDLGFTDICAFEKWVKDITHF